MLNGYDNIKDIFNIEKLSTVAMVTNLKTSKIVEFEKIISSDC